MTGGAARRAWATMRIWSGRLMFGANVVMFVALLAAFVGRGAVLTSPWDGPALASVALAAATLILGAVALGVGLLAVWGYATLREHAETIANTAARTAADAAARRVVEAWLAAPDGTRGEEVADAYRKETDA